MNHLEVKQYLKGLGINFTIHEHPPVYTVEEANKYYHNIKGLHCKNLFLKDKKSRQFYLVIMPARKRLNLEILENLLKEKLKFANESDLKQILGLTTGSVSPFGLINDKEHKVNIIIDKEILDADKVAFHPNINTETLEIGVKDFKKYINSLKNKSTTLVL